MSSERAGEVVPDPALPAAGVDSWGGTYKSGPGLYVVNAPDGGRLGLVVRDDRQWHPECDRGCPNVIAGPHKGCAEWLHRHWKEEHGWPSS